MSGVGVIERKQSDEGDCLMTDRDDMRVRKALQGKDFPADRDDLVAYATDRGEADPKVLRALSAIPAGSYATVDDAVAAVPQRPEQADQ